MSVAAPALRPISIGGAMWNLVRAAFWLSFAGLTLWVFWKSVDPATPEHIDTPGFKGEWRLFLAMSFFVLSSVGALLRRLTSGWSPRFSFQFQGELLVWTDRRTGQVVNVEVNWIGVLWNILLNFVLGTIVYILFWSPFEVILQIIFIVRTLIALATRGLRPIHSWPHRFMDLGILLSWISFLLFVAVIILWIYLGLNYQPNGRPPLPPPTIPPPTNPPPTNPPPPPPPDTEFNPTAPLYKLTLSVTIDPGEISESGDIKIHGQTVHWDVSRKNPKAASEVQLAEGHYQYHIACKGTTAAGVPLEGSGDGVLQVTRGRIVVLVRGRVNPDGRTFPADLEYPK